MNRVMISKLQQLFAISRFFLEILSEIARFFFELNPQMLFLKRFKQNVFYVNKYLRDERLGSHNLKSP